MRTLREKLKDETDPETHLHMEQAVSLFSYRIIEEIGALAAIMEGVDGLVFTGGIGEHDAVLRSDVCARLSWLGLTFDEDANQVNGPVISAAGSAIKVRVVPTDEEAVIMREVLSFVTDRSDQTMSAHIRSMS
jgi:acetate kinase